MTNPEKRGIINTGGGKTSVKIGDTDGMTTITDIKPIDFNDETAIMKAINDFANKKTFEQEYNELIDWMKNKNQEDSEARKKDTTPGKDGGLTYERQKVVKEYNRRLIELKEKYSRA